MVGGRTTNKNGLAYEIFTSLDSHCKIIEKFKHHTKIDVKGTKLVSASKYNFFKYMKDKKRKDIPDAHGCKQPDECYINEKTKQIFVIEKKFQRTTGSVCEKIQTSDFKLWQYSKLFPEYKVKYVYCLSDWFKHNCPSEINYLHENNVPVLWGDQDDYKENLAELITNDDLTSN